MATVDHVNSGLVLTPKNDEFASVKVKRNDVVEFVSDRSRSRIESPQFLPTDNSRSASFIYDGVRAGRDVRAGLSHRPVALTALPMEDICFHVKAIDNSRLKRRIDPGDKTMMGRLVILGIIVVVFCLASFGPVAAKRQSGYRLLSLNNQYQKLRVVNSQLKDHRAKLSNVQRVQGLARARGLAAAPPERYAWQDRTIVSAEANSELAHSNLNLQP